MKIIGNYVFFYGGFLSNFSEAHFKYSAFGETHEFFCSEQAFMWAKAKFFDDNETAVKILDEQSDPMACKLLGRKVAGYVDEEWAKVRFSYMRDALMEKFSQNPALRRALCDERYNGKTFVEASPTDGIWGIRRALSEPDDVLSDETKWRGTNLLGKALNEVRESLMFSQEYSNLREMSKLD